jgi:hypothetical protein
MEEYQNYDFTKPLQFRPPPTLREIEDIVYGRNRGEKRQSKDLDIQSPKKRQELQETPNNFRTDKILKEEKISFLSKPPSLFFNDWIHIKKLEIVPAQLHIESLFVDKSILNSLESSKVIDDDVDEIPRAGCADKGKGKSIGQSLRIVWNFRIHESCGCKVSKLGFLIFLDKTKHNLCGPLWRTGWICRISELEIQ